MGHVQVRELWNYQAGYPNLGVKGTSQVNGTSEVEHQAGHLGQRKQSSHKHILKPEDS